MSEKDTCDKRNYILSAEIYRTELALKLLHEKFEEQTNNVIQSFETEKMISNLG